MRLIRRDAVALTFLLDDYERGMLLRLLGLFPIAQSVSQPLSRFSDPAELGDAQALLDASLADHRDEARRELKRWMESTGAIGRTEAGFELRLELDKSEWMLQILNDIRIGSWLGLGASAEAREEPENASHEHGRLRWAMEATGYFQTVLLAALDGSSLSDEDQTGESEC